MDRTSSRYGRFRFGPLGVKPMFKRIRLLAGRTTFQGSFQSSMSLAAVLLAPILVLLPPPASRAPVRLPALEAVAEPFRVPAAEQVRIEQRVIVRVAPRAAPPLPSMLMDLPSRAPGPRFIERKIGKCLTVAGIAGVQVESRNSLLLFMRDRRIVSASLERACRSRDFYSGFYVAPTADGQLCVDRDSLQSRTGANCKLSRIRQIIDPDD